jgi:hypothetical protein
MAQNGRRHKTAGALNGTFLGKYTVNIMENNTFSGKSTSINGKKYMNLEGEE